MTSLNFVFLLPVITCSNVVLHYFHSNKRCHLMPIKVSFLLLVITFSYMLLQYFHGYKNDI